MKDDVNPATGFDAAVAGLLADAPNVEEFKRLYNECANSSQAPQFGSILADKNDDQAAATGPQPNSRSFTGSVCLSGSNACLADWIEAVMREAVGDQPPPGYRRVRLADLLKEDD